MLGGHYDSWHDATGATDNGIGSSMMLEADTDFDGTARETAQNDSNSAVERRGRRFARFAGLREAALRKF